MEAKTRAKACEEEGTQPQASRLVASACASLGQLLKARIGALDVARRTRTVLETSFVDVRGNPKGIAVKMALGVCTEADECFKAMDDELTKLSTTLTLLAETCEFPEARERTREEQVPLSDALFLNADLKCVRRQLRELQETERAVRQQVERQRCSLERARAEAALQRYWLARARARAARVQTTLARDRKRHETELGKRHEEWSVELVHQLEMQQERLTERFVMKELELRAEVDETKTAEQRMHGMEISNLDAGELRDLRGQLEDALDRVEHMQELRACYDRVGVILPSTMCPIGKQVMTEPVFAADGHSYEKAAIQRWFWEHGDKATSPMTAEALAHHDLVDNHALKSTIGEMVEAQMRELREAAGAGGAGAKRQRAAD